MRVTGDVVITLEIRDDVATLTSRGLADETISACTQPLLFELLRDLAENDERNVAAVEANGQRVEYRRCFGALDRIEAIASQCLERLSSPTVEIDGDTLARVMAASDNRFPVVSDETF